MTKKTKLIAAMVLIFAAQYAMAETNFNGYFRSGSGSNSKGGTVDCYSVKGGVTLAVGDIANAGRLGQECGTYGELQFGTTMGEVEGTKFDVQTLLALPVAQLQDYETPNTLGLRQAYGRATGFGNGALAKASVWAGKRFYDRHDVHIVDFYWMQNIGPGAGIENIDLGVGRFSYALLRTGDAGSSTVSSHDFRLQGINLGSAGSISVGANIARASNTDTVNAANDAAGVKKDGLSVWVSYSAKVMGGVQNNVVFQTSNGAASLNGGGSTGTGLMVKNDQWRIFDSINFEMGNHVNGAAFIAYGKADQTTPATAGSAATYKIDSTGAIVVDQAAVPAGPRVNTRTTDKSIVVRPVYHFDDLYSIAVEAGTTIYATDGQATNHLNKITIAPQISLGRGFYARPVLRAYVTHATWNKGGYTPVVGKFQANGGSYTGTNDTSGTSYGFQMEAWW